MAGMSWGGVIGSALAGGVGAAAAAGRDQILEQQKIDAQKLRDEQLAKLTQQTHAVNAQASSDIETAAIGPRADAQAAAMQRNEGIANSVAAAKEKALLQAKSDSAAATSAQDNKTKAAEIAATAAAQKTAILANRTPEDQKKIDAELAKVVAEGKHLDAESANQYSQAAYHNAVAKEVPGKATAKEPKEVDPQWKTDSNDKSVSRDQWGFRRKSVEDEQGPKTPSGHWYTKDTPGAVIPAHDEYTSPSGQKITYEEYQATVAKILGKQGGRSERAAAASPDALASAPSAGTTIPPAAIAKLQSNPSLAADFDLKYGVGASARYLRK